MFTGRLYGNAGLNAGLYFGHIQEAPFAHGEVVDAPLVKLVAMQTFNAVACGGNHAFDLVVFALGQRHQQGVGVEQFGCGCGDGFVFVIEQHAFDEFVAQALLGRVF